MSDRHGAEQTTLAATQLRKVNALGDADGLGKRTTRNASMLLYNANLSPNALRVRAVAHELGIELEIVDVDLRKGENKSASFLALNPNAKVPVLVDGDFVLWESRAINGYLASLDAERGLYPEDLRKRAVVDQWSYWQAIHLGPAMQRIVFERLLKSKFGMGDPDEKSLEGSLKEVAQFLAVLEANLSDKEWVAGQLSIADFAVASTFVFRKSAGMSLESAPHVSSWIDRLESRVSWQAAVRPALEFLKNWSA